MRCDWSVPWCCGVSITCDYGVATVVHLGSKKVWWTGPLRNPVKIKWKNQTCPESTVPTLSVTGLLNLDVSTNASLFALGGDPKVSLPKSAGQKSESPTSYVHRNFAAIAERLKR